MEDEKKITAFRSAVPNLFFIKMLSLSQATATVGAINLNPKNTYMYWPSGDLPGKLEFNKKVKANIREIILCEVGKLFGAEYIEGSELFSLQNIEGISGVFCLNANKKKHLVKITDRNIFIKQRQDFILYAKSKGASVNEIVAYSFIIYNDSKYLLEISPFIDGRHYNYKINDLFLIAKNLKLLHQSIQSYQNVDFITKNAKLISEKLISIRDCLKNCLRKNNLSIFFEKVDWAKKNIKWLDEMACCFNPNYYTDPRAQCLHGEVHPANVIISNDNKPFFIDFEESMHVYATVEWDLAYFVQRFCLRDNPNSFLLEQRLEVVKNGYGNFSQLSEMMRQISWYCIAMIIYLRVTHNIKVPRVEYDKFIKFEQQAKSYTGII